MKSTVVSVLLSLLPLTTAQASTASLEAAMDSYLNGANSIVVDLQQPDSNPEWVVSTITQMLDEARPVVTTFGQKYLQCEQQLAAMLDLYPQIDTWTPLQIRQNIERGTALPSASGCYAARDIIAHPAIVRAIAREGIAEASKRRLLQEMDEAIEHMEALRIEFSAQ